MVAWVMDMVTGVHGSVVGRLLALIHGIHPLRFAGPILLIITTMVDIPTVLKIGSECHAGLVSVLIAVLVAPFVFLIAASASLSIRGSTSVIIFASLYAINCVRIVNLIFKAYIHFTDGSELMTDFWRFLQTGIDMGMAYALYAALMLYCVCCYIVKPFTRMRAQRAVFTVILLVVTIVGIFVAAIALANVAQILIAYPDDPILGKHSTTLVELMALHPPTLLFLVLAIVAQCFAFLPKVRVRSTPSLPHAIVTLCLVLDRLLYLPRLALGLASSHHQWAGITLSVLDLLSVTFIWLPLYAVAPVSFVLVRGRVRRATPAAVASSPRSREYLRTFMKTRYTAEFFDFLLETARFRLMFDDGDEDGVPDAHLLEARREMASRVYLKFVADVADIQVKLKPETVTAIGAAVRGTPCRELFVQAEREAWEIVSGDIFRRFLESNAYLQMEIDLRRVGAVKPVSVLQAAVTSFVAVVRTKFREATMTFDAWEHPFLRPDVFEVDFDHDKNMKLLMNPMVDSRTLPYPTL